MKCPYVIKIQGFWNETPRWLVKSNQLAGGPCYIHLQGPRKNSPKPRWEPQTSNRLITSFVLCNAIPSERLRDWNYLKLRWSSNEAHIAPEWVLEGDGGEDGGRYQPPSVLKIIFRIPCYVGLLPSFYINCTQFHHFQVLYYSGRQRERGGDMFLVFEKSAFLSVFQFSLEFS